MYDLDSVDYQHPYDESVGKYDMMNRVEYSKRTFLKIFGCSCTNANQAPAYIHNRFLDVWKILTMNLKKFSRPIYSMKPQYLLWGVIDTFLNKHSDSFQN